MIDHDDCPDATVDDLLFGNFDICRRWGVSEIASTKIYTEVNALRVRVAELEHFTQQVYDEAQEQHLVAQAGLLLHPLQP